MRHSLLRCVVAAVFATAGAVTRPASQFVPPTHDPVAALTGLITRLLGPSFLSAFAGTVIPPDPNTGHDVFGISAPATARALDGSAAPVVQLLGNTGVALASALNWYLKYDMNASVSWGRNGSGNLLPTSPAALRRPTTTVRVSPAVYRHAPQVCTYGYSYAWYSMAQWQEEIDRWAMWGINLPLAAVGQEFVWRQFFNSIGVNDSGLAPFFSGPAFLPWQRLGDLQGWGGPLDSDWITSQRDLQLGIVAAMRAYGMTPILPGFAGHVPEAIVDAIPGINVTQSAGWLSFNTTYSSVALVEPTDPHFVPLATAFSRMMIQAYGDPTGVETPFFLADQYNEIEPNSNDSVYLHDCLAAVYSGMTGADARSMFVMQGWLFLESFWNNVTAAAYLSGVPVGRLIILDLDTDEAPLWNQFDGFYGHDWIWNALLVFGGNRGIYGHANRLASGPYQDRLVSPNCVGVGITPEAIDMIHPMFDLTMESIWRNASFDATAWLVAYAGRRYGCSADGVCSPSAAAAYTLLASAAFNSDIDRSSIENAPTVTESNDFNTNATGILEAFRLLTAAGVNGEVDAHSGPYQYDLTDINRQFLCNLFADGHRLLGYTWMAALSAGVNNTVQVNALVSWLTGLLVHLDDTNGANVNFLLGTWLADAAAWAFTPAESINRAFNARNQITLWGPNGEINDYAAKVGWAGLVSSYYLQRWSLLFGMMASATQDGMPPDWDTYYADVFAFEQAWGANTSQTFPAVPSGVDPLTLATASLQKYATGNASRYTAIPATDAGVTPAPAWKLLGTNVAAISADCPYDATGSTDSLSSCLAGCVADVTCNLVNWSPIGPNCVFRTCINPLNASLSPYPGYSVYATATGKGVTSLAAWHTDLGVLMTLCDVDPGCAGFNTAGELKSDVSARVASNVTLYVKIASATDTALSAPTPYAPEVRQQHPWAGLPQHHDSMAAAPVSTRHRRRKQKQQQQQQ